MIRANKQWSDHYKASLPLFFDRFGFLFGGCFAAGFEGLLAGFFDFAFCEASTFGIGAGEGAAKDIRKLSLAQHQWYINPGKVSL